MNNVVWNRLKGNIAVSFVGQIVNFTAQIALVPIFLAHWSKNLYGEWLVLGSIPSLMWGIEGGLAIAASSRMTIAAAANDWARANRIFNTVSCVQGIVTVIILIAAYIFTSEINVNQILDLKILNQHESSSILFRMTCSMLIAFFITLCFAAHRSSFKATRSSVIAVSWKFTDFIVTLFILIFHGGPWQVATGTLFTSSLYASIAFLDGRFQCPNIKWKLLKLYPGESRQILYDGTPMFILMVASAMNLQGFPLLINYLLGAGSVVSFTTARTAGRAILQICQTAVAASVPELSVAYGKGDFPTFRKILTGITVNSFGTGLIMAIFVAFAGPYVVSLWTHHKVLLSSLFMGTFAVTVFLQMLWNASASVLIAACRHHVFNYSYLILTCLSLGVGLFTMKRYGLVGAPLAMLVTDLSLLILGFVSIAKVIAAFPRDQTQNSDRE